MSDNKEEPKTYLLRLPMELWTQLQQLAEREQRSVNAQIIVELQRAIARENAEAVK
jgi:hypothetical protein